MVSSIMKDQYIIFYSINEQCAELNEMKFATGAFNQTAPDHT
jgi:hypothetical protein